MGFDSGGLDLLSVLLTDELRLMRVGIKKYGSINITQRLIDGAIELCEKNHITDESVDRVEVHVAPWFGNFSRYPEPQTTDQARFSIHHLMASVLITGSVTLHTFTEAAIRDPRYAAARRKIDQCVHQDRGQVLYTNGPDELIMKMKDGEEHRKHCEVTGAGPASKREVVNKFKAAAEFSGYLSLEAIERVSNLVLNLDQVQDVGEIMEVLTHGN